VILGGESGRVRTAAAELLGEGVDVEELWMAWGRLLAFAATVRSELDRLQEEMHAAAPIVGAQDQKALSHAVESAYTRVRFIQRKCGQALPQFHSEPVPDAGQTG